MNHGGAGQGAAVSGVAVDERRPLGCHAEDLADERVGLAVAVAVHREQQLGEQVISGDGEQVDQAVDRGARRPGHTGVVLEGQDDAGPRRLECFLQWAERLIGCGVAGQPGVGPADHAGVLHRGQQDRLGVLPAGADGDPAGLVPQRRHRHDLHWPIER